MSENDSDTFEIIANRSFIIEEVKPDKKTKKKGKIEDDSISIPKRKNKKKSS